MTVTSDAFAGGLTRRRFLALSAAATLAACESERPESSATSSATAALSSEPSPTARPTAAPSQTLPPSPTVAPTPSATPSATRRVLYRDAALADGRSDRPEVGVSILTEGGRITWLRPSDDEGPGGAGDVEIVDASGSTIVPGLVDCHSHVTLPGGARWIDRGDDDASALLRAAEHNGTLLTRAGVRWARDVGAPIRDDPAGGRARAVSIGLRDRWREQPERPYIRAAGTWLTRAGTLPGGLGLEARNADELLELALRQLDDGADLVKLYLDGPDAATSPWSASEIRRVVDAVHDRRAKVTAHSGRLDGARAGVQGGVDSLEHGFELDAAVCRAMAERNTTLVTTLTVMRSWLTFGRTTRMDRFTTAAGRTAIAERLERSEASVRLARAAGVRIATGTDFGGGSARANQLAWEVESLVAAGLEPWEALGSATWIGGELLGEPEAGRIREGGPADFVLVHGDPTSDPRAMWRVWRVAWAD